MIRLRTALLPALLLALAAPASAQEASPAAPARPLTLEQARERARESNPAYRQVENAVVSARAGELASRSQLFLPNLSASVGTNGSLQRSFSGTDDFGRPIRRDDPLEFRGSGTNQNLSLGLTVFDGGARYRRMRAAQEGREAALAGVAAAASSLNAELARRYYEAQRTAALIALEEELLRAAEAKVEVTQRLLRVASADPLDLMGAEIDLVRQQQAVESARGAARVAMLALAQQMGAAEAEGWTLTSELPEVFDPARLDADALVERAYGVSPQLAQHAAQVRQAEQERRAAGGARWPTVSLNTGASRSIGTQGYGALFDPGSLNQGLNFGISFSIPLLAQYQTTQQITQARIAAANAEESARATRLQINVDIRTALVALNDAYRTVVVNNAATELARRRLELADERFRRGTLSFTDLQTIVLAAATAERDALNARFSFASALATLEERVGMVNEEW